VGDGPVRRFNSQARRFNRATCSLCGQLGSLDEGGHCLRCGQRLHFRRVDSLSRTWALLVAAYLLYLPANLLPIMETRKLYNVQIDTIMSGVVYLWTTGAKMLATIVFLASIVVPLLKLLSLTLLAISVQLKVRWQPLPRTRLYRFLERIGRWSMLDIYVVTLLVAVVQSESLARVTPGGAVVAFGAVVVLTMLATLSFDPRLIWDALSEPKKEQQ
jgi:paraquat-inducible protein A